MEVTNKGKERVDGFYDTIKVKEKVVNWQPPNPESIKINVDASFVEAISSASVGVVARNHLGEVIISSWDYIGVCNSMYEAELRAALAGLYIGITLHKPIILETDCSFVAFFLGKDYLDRSSLVDLKMEALSISRLMRSFNISKLTEGLIGWRMKLLNLVLLIGLMV